MTYALIPLRLFLLAIPAQPPSTITCMADGVPSDVHLGKLTGTPVTNNSTWFSWRLLLWTSAITVKLPQLSSSRLTNVWPHLRSNSCIFQTKSLNCKTIPPLYFHSTTLSSSRNFFLIKLSQPYFHTKKLFLTKSETLFSHKMICQPYFHTKKYVFYINLYTIRFLPTHHRWQNILWRCMEK